MIKTFEIPTHLKLNLSAIYDAPDTPGPYPLVILLHGFTGHKGEGHIRTLATALNEADIAALRFDAPGSGQSEGTWAQDYRLTNYISVVPEVLDYAIANLHIDPKRVAIWGHSMGGFVALHTAISQPESFVAVCGSQSSIGKKQLAPEVEAKWRNTGWADFSSSTFPDLKLPFAFYEDRLQYDAVKELPKLKMPVLLIAGTTDDQAPVGQVKSIYDAAPEPKTYLEFPTGHFYKHEPEVMAKINTATVDFFKKYL